MAVSCIVSEIKRNIGRNLDFFISLHLTQPIRGLRRSIAMPFHVEKPEWCGYQKIKSLKHSCSVRIKHIIIRLGKNTRISTYFTMGINVRNNILWSEEMFSRCDTLPACDGQSDRQTSCDNIVCALNHRAVIMQRFLTQYGRSST